MLDRVLKNALIGVTVIEEETGSVGRILAKQMAKYAEAEGKKVVLLSFGTEERPTLEKSAPSVDEAPSFEELKLAGKAVSLKKKQTVHVADAGVEEDGMALESYGSDQKRSFLEGLNYDIIIIDSFSTYLYSKTEVEVQEMIREVARISRREKKTFIITYDRGLMPERITAFLGAMADSVIVIKAKLTSDRVTRMLYIPKMRESAPLDKLIKITIDSTGVQEDTREFVG
jgi:KaiC/GvpD/RAD55 family RecA-like ATPase